jgi:hypothetical protein
LLSQSQQSKEAFYFVYDHFVQRIQDWLSTALSDGYITIVQSRTVPMADQSQFELDPGERVLGEYFMLSISSNVQLTISCSSGRLGIDITI